MNIQEANKMIAEFMEVDSHIHKGLCNIKKSNCLGYSIATYHSSWDALMPVIFKLKQEVQFICFSKSQAQELVDDIDDSISYCQGISVTHECVVAFIKELNQEKNKSHE